MTPPTEDYPEGITACPRCKDFDVTDTRSWCALCDGQRWVQTELAVEYTLIGGKLNLVDTINLARQYCPLHTPDRQ